MAKLTSFSDFVNSDDKPQYNNPKPYIYVIKYILGKEDYVDELKEYILNYHDEFTDYEDDKSFDPFMKDLKTYADQDDVDGIEDMVLNYYDDEPNTDYLEDDEDLEERMYNKYGFSGDDKINNYSENNILSDDLKEFLNIDINFEDLDDNEILTREDYYDDEDDEDDEDILEVETIEIDEDEYGPSEEDIKDIDYEEIIEEALIIEEEEEENIREELKIKVPKMKDEIEEIDIEDKKKDRKKDEVIIEESIEEIEEDKNDDEE